MSIKTTARPCCPACGGEGRILHAHLRDRLYAAPGEWTLKRCVDPACGLAWLDPAPAEEEVGALYASYFTHDDGAPAWENNSPLFRAWVALGGIYRAAMRATPMGQLRARAEMMYLPPGATGTLLDVGCGSGTWLARARAAGWQGVGQETDARAAEYARNTHGLDVRVGTLHDLHLDPNVFDAVTLSHVIEHVRDFADLLAGCCRVLKPGGRLVALTPNLRSFGYKQFGVHWVALEPPRHLQLFTPQSLAQVARRAGFTEVNVWTNAVRAQFILIASEDIRRTGRHSLSKAYTLGQLLPSIVFEQRAWAAHRSDPSSGDELVLEAVK